MDDIFCKNCAHWGKPFDTYKGELVAECSEFPRCEAFRENFGCRAFERKDVRVVHCTVTVTMQYDVEVEEEIGDTPSDIASRAEETFVAQMAIGKQFSHVPVRPQDILEVTFAGNTEVNSDGV